MSELGFELPVELGTNSSLTAGFGQAQAFIAGQYFKNAQAQADIRVTTRQFSQAQADIKASGNKFAQAQAYISRNITQWIGSTPTDHAESGFPNITSSAVTRTLIGVFNADETGTWSFQVDEDDAAQFYVNDVLLFSGNYGNTPQSGTIALTAGRTYVWRLEFQAGGDPNRLTAWYKRPSDGSYILLNDHHPPWRIDYPSGFGQAQAQINSFGVQKWAQAQAKINAFGQNVFGQAQSSIKQIRYGSGQAQTQVGHFQVAQAQATIIAIRQVYAQAQAQIGHLQFAQSQARIKATTNQFAQAQTYVFNIEGVKYAQAQAWIKQTYPLMGIDVNYALVPLGALASDSTGQLLIPTNAIDGNDYGPAWTILAANGQWLKVDLGQDRLINYIRILPITYDCTVSLQISHEGVFWFDYVTGIQFNTGLFDDVDTSRAVIMEIPPITIRWWRLLVTDGGTYNGASILSFEIGFATVKSGTFAQAQAFIGHFGVAQAQAYISPGVSFGRGQAQTQIVRPAWGLSQAQTWVIPPTVIAQAQADIKAISKRYAQAQAWVIPPTVIAQAQARIIAFGVKGFGQAQTDTRVTKAGFGQAKAMIHKSVGFGQAQAQIKSGRRWVFGLARVFIGHFNFGLAQAYIRKSAGYGQARVQIKRTQPPKSAQAQAFIMRHEGYGQARVQIQNIGQGYGQAKALLNQGFGLGQAQAALIQVYNGYGQAIVRIKQTYTTSAQAQTILHARRISVSQAQAKILRLTRGFGQAQTYIGHYQFAQAQARILAFSVPKVAQAQSYILVNITNPPGGGGGSTPRSDLHTYLVRYNDQDLPGYAQSESYDSIMNISTHSAAYMDASLSEYVGLQNKLIELTMKAWEPNYQLVKEQINKAATMLRSTKGFAKLYIQQPDAYFLALVQKIEVAKQVGESMKVLDYRVTFEAKPWLISKDIYEISGGGLVNTVGRTLSDGGWTPVTLRISGTDITITGVTEAGELAGEINIIGSCTDLIIDTENFTATENGINRNDIIANKDYSLYVGPGNTFFTITGATSCVIQYHNRWYLSSVRGILASTQPITVTPIVPPPPPPVIQPIRRYAQARVFVIDITTKTYGYAQTSIINPTKQIFGQAIATINNPTKVGFGSAKALINSPKKTQIAQARVVIAVLPVAPTLSATPGDAAVSLSWS